MEGLRKGYASRWTDFLPSTGKRSGASSTGVYGVHPYQLLNFNGQYDDLSTLAHESGHSMHTALAYANQPYPTAEYPTFVAEVASTLNQKLLLHHMLEKAKDDEMRLALLGSYLDRVRADPVPPDPVRRLRARLPPAGGAGRAPDRGEPDRPLSQDCPGVLRP